MDEGRVGKISDRFFRENVLDNLGFARGEVVVEPQMGVDAAVFRSDDEFLVVAEDPVFPFPGGDWREFGYFTVHIGASDVAVMGVAPRYMTYCLLVPPDTSEKTIAEIISGISDCAEEMGIAIVGGHTGYSPAVNQPIIGGITVFGTGDEIVTPAGAEPGDRILITKGAAVEAAAILASAFEAELQEAGVDADTVLQARARIDEMSVVTDALLAARVEGVHAMHDATEGGVLRGLYEVASASGIGLAVARDRIAVPADIAEICRAFDIDPLISISEGTLVLSCTPEAAEQVAELLEGEGIEVFDIGQAVEACEGMRFTDTGEELVPPEEDPFWKALLAGPK